MNPVTGPFNSFPTGSFQTSIRQKYKQAKPYNLVLPYNMYDYFGMVLLNYSNSSGGSLVDRSKQANFNLGSIPGGDRFEADVYNQAYAKFKDQVRDSAGWAENIAQVDKARKMVNDRAEQLLRFAMAVKTGSPRQMFDVLVHSHAVAGYGDRRKDDMTQRLFGRKFNNPPRPGDKAAVKSVASSFLEYEYGWRPLIKDFQSSMDILLSDPGERSVFAKKTDRLPWSGKTYGYGSFGSFTSDTWNSVVTLSFRIGANVRVINPNVALAVQLGLLDIALPFKLIPYSFVLNWFVNVEQVISSVTDWYGLQMTQPYFTRLCHGFYYEKLVNLVNYSPTSWENFITTKTKDFVEMRRTNGIPGPSLIVKPFKGFSLERGAQAISLLIGLLKK